jgi:AcrR family transcriptional regulator
MAKTGPPAAEASARRPRADAVRNRARLIEAASEAFREEGLEVSVAEIARRAGVGAGALFRNFPTKEDLVSAIFEQRIGEWTAVAEAALADEDPVKAFEEFALRAADAQYRDRGLMESYKAGMLERPELYERKCEAMRLSEAILERAQKANAVRRDITADDLGNLIGAAVGAATSQQEQSGGDAPLEFYLRILLDGLRPS